jgi:hypothetical protein
MIPLLDGGSGLLSDMAIPRTRSSLRRGMLVAAALVGCALVSGGSSAASQNRTTGPYEPNDSAFEPYGPLAGGVTYHAALEPTKGGRTFSLDRDFYSLYTAGPTAIDLTLHAPAAPKQSYCDSATVALLDSKRDERIHATFGTVRPADRTLTLHYNVAAAHSYFVDVERHTVSSHSKACVYDLRIDPASALTTVKPQVPEADTDPPATCVKAATGAPAAYSVNATRDHKHVTYSVTISPLRDGCALPRDVALDALVPIDAGMVRSHGGFGVAPEKGLVLHFDAAGGEQHGTVAIYPFRRSAWRQWCAIWKTHDWVATDFTDVSAMDPLNPTADPLARRGYHRRGSALRSFCRE